ncbi:MAG: hypothetical protein IPQ13_10695 [Holophagaceae bacterium]|nr:hypothetical protein [Holophagaceae bacterium]
MRHRFAAFAFSAIPLLAQAPCDCIDKADIKERIKRDSAAIEAYGKEIVKMAMTPYTTPGRVALQGRVNTAMSATNTPGRIPLQASGSTDNSCNITVNAPTKCLEAAIRAHEKVHQDACRATYDQHHVIFRRKAMDRFEALNMTMAGYIMEEVSGYQAELLFLHKELARLEKDCQPPPPPPHGRDYSSRSYTPNEDHGTSPSPAPAPSRNSDPTKPKPMVKPKPLPTPKPIY